MRELCRTTISWRVENFLLMGGLRHNSVKVPPPTIFPKQQEFNFKTLIQENRKQEFPLAQTRELIRDLYQPNPWIYWADFLVSAALGWVAFIATLKVPLFSLEQGLCFFIAVFAVYRAALFIHEIAHFKKGSFLIFQNVWNLICGFPLMVPTFL